MTVLSSPRSLLNDTSPRAEAAGWSGTPSSVRNLIRLRSGMRLARYSRLSVRKAKTSTSVTPGSLLLKFVHSGLCTGIRARPSSSQSWYFRSSSVGMVSGIYPPSVTLKLTRSRAWVATSL